MNKDRILADAERLEQYEFAKHAFLGVEKLKFNMGVFGRRFDHEVQEHMCNTAACAIGSLAIIGHEEFAPQYSPSTRDMSIGSKSRGPSGDAFDVAARWYAIDRLRDDGDTDACTLLFGGDYVTQAELDIEDLSDDYWDDLRHVNGTATIVDAVTEKYWTKPSDVALRMRALVCYGDNDDFDDFCSRQVRAMIDHDYEGWKATEWHRFTGRDYAAMKGAALYPAATPGGSLIDFAAITRSVIR